MPPYIHKVIATCLCAAALAACGGGGSRSTATSATIATAVPTSAAIATDTGQTNGAATATAIIAQGPTATSTLPALASTNTPEPQIEATATLAPTAAVINATSTPEPTTVVDATSTLAPTTPTAEVTPTEALPTSTAPDGAPGNDVPLPKGYKLFESEIHPYSIGYPSGWTARPEAIKVGDISADAFVKQRRAQSNADAVVNVISQPLPPGRRITSREYLRLNAESIKRIQGATLQNIGEVTVDGEKAYLVAWKYKKGAEPGYDSTQAYWVDGDQGWVATLTTQRGERDKHLPIFKEMLRTMRIQ